MASHQHPPTIGVVLAGGQARRMGGGDKMLRMIAGANILARVIARLGPQCDGLMLNANGDPARFAAFGLPVISDTAPDCPGPLAGLLAALDAVAVSHPDVEWLVSVAADVPFLPLDLVARLHAVRAAQSAEIAIAASGRQDHHVIGLWPVSLRAGLREALIGDGMRRVGAFIARYRLARAVWPVEPFDPFFNVNTPDDLAEAGRLAGLV